MLDLKILKQDIANVAKSLATRGFILDSEQFIQLETKRKQLQIQVEDLQSKRNASAKSIGFAKAKGDDIAPLLKEVENLKLKLADLDTKLQTIQASIRNIVELIPNMPLASVPIGKDESSNQEVRITGEIPKFDFSPKDHVQLGRELNHGLDFATASKISGSRFVLMQGKIAKLHRALIQFMLDVHIEEYGFEEVYVPYIVNSKSMFSTGQLPKFKNDSFALSVDDTLSESANSKEMYLIPTAEVPVTNIFRDQVINIEDLPIKRVCHTPCFRSEAGSYGQDTKGLIRQHQFEKVEMVLVVEPEKSIAALEQLTKCAETILQKLELPFRVMNLCTGDLGFASAQTYDLEVWLPSQNTYREISSCSNFWDFQARRMNAKYRNPKSNKLEFVHTLNGSGLAVGRTLVAIMENYQNADGSITIPKALRPLMNGLTQITKEKL